MSAGEPLPGSRSRGARLWWWVMLAFALQIAAWTAWFVIARRHPVQEVPVVSLMTRYGGAAEGLLRRCEA